MSTKSKFSLFLLCIFICVAVGQEPIPEGDLGQSKASVPSSLDGLYTEDVPAEMKNEFEARNGNAEDSEEVCVDEKNCFTQIPLPYCPHDHDCACPMTCYHYVPRPVLFNGTRWIPFPNQRARVRRCVNVSSICPTQSWQAGHNRCFQIYQCRAFLYYTFSPYFRVTQLYLRIPSCCVCACGLPSCPVLKASPKKADVRN